MIKRLLLLIPFFYLHNNAMPMELSSPKKTPLMKSVKNNDLKTFCKLIQNRCNINALSHKKKYVRDYNIIYNHKALKNIFLSIEAIIEATLAINPNEQNMKIQIANLIHSKKLKNAITIDHYLDQCGAYYSQENALFAILDTCPMAKAILQIIYHQKSYKKLSTLPCSLLPYLMANEDLFS